MALKKTVFFEMMWAFLCFVKVTWCLQRGIDRIGFGSHGHVRKSPNHAKEELFGFSQNQIEKLLVQNEAESYYGAFGHICSINLQ